MFYIICGVILWAVAIASAAAAAYYVPEMAPFQTVWGIFIGVLFTVYLIAKARGTI